MCPEHVNPQNEFGRNELRHHLVRRIGRVNVSNEKFHSQAIRNGVERCGREIQIVQGPQLDLTASLYQAQLYRDSARQSPLCDSVPPERGEASPYTSYIGFIEKTFEHCTPLLHATTDRRRSVDNNARHSLKPEGSRSRFAIRRLTRRIFRSEGGSISRAQALPIVSRRYRRSSLQRNQSGPQHRLP